MPRPVLVTKARLEKAISILSGRLNRAPTSRELARHLSAELNLEITEKYVAVKKSEYELTTPQLNHSKWFPVKLKKEDIKSKEAQYIRVLGALADEEMRPMVAVNKAAGWAARHVDKDLDVEYIPGRPAGERWEYFRRDPNNWFLKDLLTAAEAGLKKLLTQ